MSTVNTTLNTYVMDTVAELASVDRAALKGDERLRQDLGLDSMQSMELLSRVSEHFDVDPDMDEVMAVVTINDVVTTLGKHIPA